MMLQGPGEARVHRPGHRDRDDDDDYYYYSYGHDNDDAAMCCKSSPRSRP